MDIRWPNIINPAITGIVPMPKENISSIAFSELMVASAAAMATYTRPQGRRPFNSPTGNKEVGFLAFESNFPSPCCTHRFNLPKPGTFDANEKRDSINKRIMTPAPIDITCCNPHNRNWLPTNPNANPNKL